MNKAALLFCLFASTVFGADSVKFTERRVDKVVVTHNVPALVTTMSGTINATLLIPGFGTATNTDDTVWTFHLANFQFSDTVGHAVTKSKNSVTFSLLDPDTHLKVGQINFSRSGDTLTVTATSSDIPTGIVTADISPTGSVSGLAAFSVSLGAGLEKSGMIYDKVTGTTTHSVVLGQSFTLVNSTASGEFDVTKPTVTMTSPRPAQRLTSDAVTVSGKAADNFSLQLVRVFLDGQVANEDPTIFNGDWSTTVNVTTAGPHVIAAQAIDGAGNTSLLASATVTRVIMAPLELNIDAGGKVIGATNKQTFEAAKKFTVTAVADVGFVFLRWEASTGQTSNVPTLSITMPQAGLTLHAVFAPTTFYGLVHQETVQQNAATNAGSITITRTASGVLSGKIVFEGIAIPFSGKQLSPTSSVEFDISRTGKPPLHVTLAINGTRISGRVSDGTFSSLVDAFSAGSTVNKWGTRYTAVLNTQTPDPSIAPFGYSPMTITVAGANATITINFSDGSTTTTTAPLLADVGSETALPIYVSLQGGKGMLLGLMTLNLVAPGHVVVGSSGPFSWLRGAAPTDKLYKAPFSLTGGFYGANYQSISPTGNAVGFTDAVVVFNEGNVLPAGSSNTYFLKFATVAGPKITVSDNPADTTAPKATNLNAHITLTPPTGAVTADFKNPANGSTTKINAIIVQHPVNGAVVAGYFDGVDRTGAFIVQKRQ